MSALKKKQVLTVLPQSWTIEKEFYLSDAIGRMMPGSISVRVNGEKEHVQKRLLLSSMHEAYQQFQVDHPGMKIGLTKFVELRPKNVVLAGLVALTMYVFVPCIRMLS